MKLLKRASLVLTFLFAFVALASNLGSFNVSAAKEVSIKVVEIDETGELATWPAKKVQTVTNNGADTVKALAAYLPAGYKYVGIAVDSEITVASSQSEVMLYIVKSTDESKLLDIKFNFVDETNKNVGNTTLNDIGYPGMTLSDVLVGKAFAASGITGYEVVNGTYSIQASGTEVTINVTKVKEYLGTATGIRYKISGDNVERDLFADRQSLTSSTLSKEDLYVGGKGQTLPAGYTSKYQNVETGSKINIPFISTYGDILSEKLSKGMAKYVAKPAFIDWTVTSDGKPYPTFTVDEYLQVVVKIVDNSTGSPINVTPTDPSQPSGKEFITEYLINNVSNGINGKLAEVNFESTLLSNGKDKIKDYFEKYYSLTSEDYTIQKTIETAQFLAPTTTLATTKYEVTFNVNIKDSARNTIVDYVIQDENGVDYKIGSVPGIEKGSTAKLDLGLTNGVVGTPEIEYTLKTPVPDPAGGTAPDISVINGTVTIPTAMQSLTDIQDKLKDIQTDIKDAFATTPTGTNILKGKFADYKVVSSSVTTSTLAGSLGTPDKVVIKVAPIAGKIKFNYIDTNGASVGTGTIVDATVASNYVLDLATIPSGYQYKSHVVSPTTATVGVSNGILTVTTSSLKADWLASKVPEITITVAKNLNAEQIIFREVGKADVALPLTTAITPDRNGKVDFEFENKELSSAKTPLAVTGAIADRYKTYYKLVNLPGPLSVTDVKGVGSVILEIEPITYKVTVQYGHYNAGVLQKVVATTTEYITKEESMAIGSSFGAGATGINVNMKPVTDYNKANGTNYSLSGDQGLISEVKPISTTADVYDGLAIVKLTDSNKKQVLLKFVDDFGTTIFTKEIGEFEEGVFPSFDENGKATKPTTPLTLAEKLKVGNDGSHAGPSATDMPGNGVLKNSYYVVDNAGKQITTPETFELRRVSSNPDLNVYPIKVAKFNEKITIQIFDVEKDNYIAGQTSSIASEEITGKYQGDTVVYDVKNADASIKTAIQTALDNHPGFYFAPKTFEVARAGTSGQQVNIYMVPKPATITWVYKDASNVEKGRWIDPTPYTIGTAYMVIFAPNDVNNYGNHIPAGYEYGREKPLREYFIADGDIEVVVPVKSNGTVTTGTVKVNFMNGATNVGSYTFEANIGSQTFTLDSTKLPVGFVVDGTVPTTVNVAAGTTDVNINVKATTGARVILKYVDKTTGAPLRADVVLTKPDGIYNFNAEPITGYNVEKSVLGAIVNQANGETIVTFNYRAK